eukprot:TRINITY_DN8407_c0_g1_i1.p1 TRINITY_DN8407_c0_g1~~TRINITY_DN8407_c0_g1_i1.p1  ORF type:complete len:422 (-),score=103.64 TRINITY_DN8407_c0_g1_i1:79-1344(-)
MCIRDRYQRRVRGLQEGTMKSAMMLAARQEMDPKPAKFNMARAATLVAGDSWESLDKAIRSHDVEGTIGILTASGMSVNAQDADGKTPLMLAVEHGDHAITHELVNRGASIEIQDKHGRTAFDFALPGATTATERDSHLNAAPSTSSVPPQVLAAMTQALYACARNRPTDQTPCQFMAEYLREYNSSRYPIAGMKLPGKELLETEAGVEKPLGVSSNEMNIALEFFRKFDVDNTGTLEVEESVLLVMRMANQIAGRHVPDQTILRATKTLLSEASASDGMIHKSELAAGLERICPVFRSFRSQLSGLKATETKETAVKSVEDVVEDSYADFDLNADGILMPDEITLLLRRVADHSGMQISDTQVIELFRLMMNHSMQDKDADGVLTKDEIKSALVMVMDFFHETILKKYGSATHEGTALRW